ncbi:MAG: DUF2007 domain-containing protein [Oligoflexus sp.]|nr:DUF2007 domain-containing protein [Oligoflexus sp.]
MSEEIRKLTSYSDRMEGEMAASFLKACGIDVLVRSDDAGGINNAMTASNGIHLFVHESQLEEALELLKTDMSETK